MFARASKRKQAGSAGRWIWQVRRAAVLAAQEGPRTRGATTGLDGCDRESLLFDAFCLFHLRLHLICTCITALLCDKCCSVWARRRRAITAAAHATSSPGLGARQCDQSAKCRQAPWSFLPGAPWPSEGH